jgi:alpha-L-rhamnosidase
MAKIAGILGKKADEGRYLNLALKIKDAFNRRFFDPNVGYYDTGVQSAQAWPLAFGLVPDEYRRHVTDYLCDSVARRQRRLTTGYAGTKFAIQALSEAGRDDIVWKLAGATDYPSWGYMLNGNRTTTTEHWDGVSGSLNHAPLGAAIDEWFYWGLAGIRPDESNPGYERIIYKPFLPSDLSWVRASLRTVRGQVVSEWQKDGSSVRLTVVVPANSSGEIHIPFTDPKEITESGAPCDRAEGVKGLSSDDHKTIIGTGSGTYHFAFPAPTRRRD